MKKLMLAISLAAISLIVLVPAGCRTFTIPGGDPGSTVTREFDITDFNRVETGSAFKIEVTRSDTFIVKVTAGENIFKYLDISKSGSTLTINLKGIWNFGRLTLEAVVTMPDLQVMKMSGAANGSAKRFESNNKMDVELSGASRLDLDVKTGDFHGEATGASRITGLLDASGTGIELTGASRAELSGSGGNLRLDTTGASTAALETFAVNDVNVTMSGACHGDLYVKGRLEGNLSGASSVRYSGNPTLVQVDTSGGSTISKR
jgi:hypothetical protein